METSFRALITQLHGMLFGVFFLALGGPAELCRSLYETRPSELAHAQRPLAPTHLLRLHRALRLGRGFVGGVPGLPVSRHSAGWRRQPHAISAGFVEVVCRHRGMAQSRYGMERAHCLVRTIAMTMAAYVATKYGSSIREHPQVRRAVLVFVIAAFIAAGVAGYFGAMINKHAPVNGGATIRWSGR